MSKLVLAGPAGFEPFDAGAARWMKEYWTEGRAQKTPEWGVRAAFTQLAFNRNDPGVERLIEERVRMRHTARVRRDERGGEPQHRGHASTTPCATACTRSTHRRSWSSAPTTG